MAHRYVCLGKATVERNGKPYCTQHDPEVVKARRQAISDRRHEQRAQAIARREKDKDRKLELERQAALADELEAALKSLTDMYVTRDFIVCRTPKHASDMTRKERKDSPTWRAWDNAQAALAKYESAKSQKQEG